MHVVARLGRVALHRVRGRQSRAAGRIRAGHQRPGGGTRRALEPARVAHRLRFRRRDRDDAGGGPAWQPRDRDCAAGRTEGRPHRLRAAAACRQAGRHRAPGHGQPREGPAELRYAALARARRGADHPPTSPARPANSRASPTGATRQASRRWFASTAAAARATCSSAWTTPESPRAQWTRCATSSVPTCPSRSTCT